jgi:cystathionine beta-synthase
MLGLVTMGHLLSKIASGRVKTSDPVSSAMFQFDVKRPFIEIGLDTTLGELEKFFEANSAAIVTTKDNEGNLQPKKVVTKVDLLSFILKTQK